MFFSLSGVHGHTSSCESKVGSAEAMRRERRRRISFILDQMLERTECFMNPHVMVEKLMERCWILDRVWHKTAYEASCALIKTTFLKALLFLGTILFHKWLLKNYMRFWTRELRKPVYFGVKCCKIDVFLKQSQKLCKIKTTFFKALVILEAHNSCSMKACVRW